jgi:hypothetical protein
MKNDPKKLEKLLEKVTAADPVPAEEFDPETAPLRETWLTLSRMLEACDEGFGDVRDSISPLPQAGEGAGVRDAMPVPPALTLTLSKRERVQNLSPLSLRDGPGVKAEKSRIGRHWLGLSTAGLLAASLLIALVAFWILHGADRQGNPEQIAQPKTTPRHQTMPSLQALAKSEQPADAPQWEDSLDDQFTQVGWQMLLARQNELFRTDAFGQVQYQMEQFRQTIQTDSL